VLLPLSAHAANVDIQPTPDLPLGNMPQPAIAKSPTVDGWKFSVGGGVSHAPRYEGAARDRLRFMPMLEASYNNGKIFLSPMRGIGYNFSEAKGLQYGVRLTIGRNRKQTVDPHLNGMGDIDFTPEIGIFFNQRFAPWFISSGITTSDHGTHVELGGGIGLPLSATDRLRLAINVNWGDRKYNQTYFGITAAQAAASGNVLTAYDAAAGNKDHAFTANWVHNFDQAWSSSAGLSYKWLAGSAAHSPLTQRSSAGSANLALGYRF